MNILRINENPLSFLGDIHGNWDVIINHFEGYNITNVNIIQVGDFGVGYLKKEVESEKLKNLSSFLKERNSFLYVIRGNHDDPSYFYASSIITYFNIIFLQDYSILQNSIHNILCIGGAVSIDRRVSKEQSIIIGRNLWWEDEKFDYNEVEIDNILEKLQIDIVVTHTAPKMFYPQHFNHTVTEYAKDDAMLIYDLVLERNLLQNLYEKFYDRMMPQYWFYGHFHSSNNELVEEKVKAVLLDIDELYYLYENK
jgi:DNA repair exonuclease SbcCD nuclease subunit